MSMEEHMMQTMKHQADKIEQLETEIAKLKDPLGMDEYKTELFNLRVRIQDRNEQIAELVEALNLLASNWPKNRDGMDYEPLPSGIHAARELLAKHTTPSGSSGAGNV